ncbi:MAG: hypothetical protein DLM52_00310 [Chthoniobacterales bacterium]|nr:MAG: hypothetical protein DLM52_00310 [Chthoniobacterales bacterium]
MASIRARESSDGYATTRQRASRSVPRWTTAGGLWLLGGANAAFIIALWLRGGGIAQVHTAGELWTSVGRITGLLGAYLLLIQVFLLVRFPPLERLVGFDRLTVWHRLNGKICLGLILAHVVLITVGYAMMDRISLPAEASALLTNYPGMVTATVGTVLLVLVLVSSLVIVRRRLRYEAWYGVHLMAYAGIVFGWFHQIPTGNEFITNQPAAMYWTGLYLATLALLVLFRLAHPTLRAFWHRLRVAEVTVESANVVSVRLTGTHLDRLNAHAGQFFLWRFLGAGRWWESHPFSLSAVPDGRSLRITIKNVGDFTRHIGALRPGTAVVAEGPFGIFTAAARRHDNAVLIAGGIGITPIRALLEEMSGELILIYRVLSEDDLVFRDELEQLARRRVIALHYVVGDHRAAGAERLLSAEHLREMVPDIRQRDIYICGPPAMADLIEKHVQRTGAPRTSIHIERFAL